MRASIRAAKRADAGRNGNRAGMAGTDNHRMQIDRIFVDIQSVDDVRPGPPGIEAPDQSADLETGVDRVGIGRIDRDAEHSLRHRFWTHRDVGERHLDRKRFPGRAVVDTADDSARLVPGEDSLRLGWMTRERPDRKPRRWSGEPAPCFAGILTAPDTVLGSDGDSTRMCGIGQYCPNLRRWHDLRTDRLPSALAVPAPIEPGRDEAARIGVAAEADIDMEIRHSWSTSLVSSRDA